MEYGPEIARLDERIKAHDMLFVERERQVALALASRDKAIELASEALAGRLDHSNGLIAMMKERDTEKATRIELERLREDVQELKQGASAGSGRSAGIAAVISGLIAIAALAAAVWK